MRRLACIRLRIVSQSGPRSRLWRHTLLSAPLGRGGGSHPSRSARLERKHRAHRLPPCTHHIQVSLRHRHLAESAADITVGARRSDKLLRTWLINTQRLDRAHLAIVLRELDAARSVHLRDLLKGFLPVDGHGGDLVFTEAERAHTILASFVAEDLDLVSAVEPFNADTPGVTRFVGPIAVGAPKEVDLVGTAEPFVADTPGAKQFVGSVAVVVSEEVDE